MVVRRVKPIVYFVIVATYVVSASLFVHFGMQLSPYYALGLLLIALAGPVLVREGAHVLAYKEIQHDAYWFVCAEECAEFYRQHGRLPQKGDKESKHLCLWLDDVRHLATAFGLTKEQADAARMAHVEFHKEPKIVEFGKPCNGLVSYITCSLLLVVAIAPVALCASSAWVVAIYSMIVCILAICVICDLSARIIPFGWCIVLAACAFAFQIAASGLQIACIMLAVSLAVCVLIGLADRFLQSIGKAGQIGRGDIYMLLGALVAGFPGGLAASAGMIVTFACWLCVEHFLGRAHARAYVPFAPFIAVFAIIGMAIPQLVAACA